MIASFAILAAVALISAILVVSSRSPLNSALWLALTLVAVAGIFVILGAQFLAAVQVMVYAGAILVFFLFVIMLLNLGKLEAGDGRPVQRWLGIYLALTVATLLAFAIHMGGSYGEKGEWDATQVAEVGNTEALASVLYRDYIFPFEVAGLLLTAAVVGAVVLAKKRSPSEGRR